MPFTIKTLLMISLLLLSYQTYAGPLVKVCLDDDCKKPAEVTISETCWSQVKEIFSTPFSTDKDEQDNIITSISLIESDIYSALSKHTTEQDDANDLYTSNSIKNNYRNTKYILGVLLDQHMVEKHFIRKTITITNWAGFESNGLLLQSLTDSKLYILESNNTQLGSSAIIKSFKKNSDNTSEIIKINDTPETRDSEDEFE